MPTRRLLLSIVVMGATLAVSAQSAAEKEILDLETRRSAAIASHDKKFLEDLYADDFAGTAANGKTIDKAAILKLVSNDDPSITFSREETRAQIYGTTAISTGRLLGKLADGKVVVDSRYMHIYAKIKGKWKIVAAQGTPSAKQ